MTGLDVLAALIVGAVVVLIGRSITRKWDK